LLHDMKVNQTLKLSMDPPLDPGLRPEPKEVDPDHWTAHGIAGHRTSKKI